MPDVSVLMPVYNGMPYLPAALDSLLAQDHAEIQIIAIDDGSTDDSGAYLDGVRDPRLRVVHQVNRGLAATLNIALALSSSTYVARQDQDDISHPSRLSQQVAYLEAHGRCGLLGTWADVWDEDRPSSRTLRHPTTNAQLQVLGLFDSRFVHSSVMARRESMVQAGGYPTAADRNPPEDFDLWSRMAGICELATLPQTLVTYREVGTSISRKQAATISTRVRTIAAENLTRLLGPEKRPALYADVVAAVRWEMSEPSGGSSWHDLDGVLQGVTTALAARFPSESTHIRRIVARLRMRVARRSFRRALAQS